MDSLVIPADIRDEIWLSLLLLAVCVGHLRWPISNCVGATDATPNSGGAVRGYVNNDVALSLYRASEYTGSHIHLHEASPSAD
eukprot:6644968-Karenia_brevis.AAC.1